MADKIALTVDTDNNLCTFPESSCLRILTKDGNIWQTETLLPLDLNVKKTEELRKRIRTVIDLVPECRILLSVAISGIPYHVFDKMGFSIFEAASVTNNLLDEIVVEISRNKEKLESDSLIPRAPYEISEGFYYFDYMLLESKHPEITTKKALLPFFDSTPFFSLTIRMSHIPPWLEMGIFAKKFEITSKPEGNGLIVSIRHKNCKG